MYLETREHTLVSRHERQTNQKERSEWKSQGMEGRVTWFERNKNVSIIKFDKMIYVLE